MVWQSYVHCFFRRQSVTNCTSLNVSTCQGGGTLPREALALHRHGITVFNLWLKRSLPFTLGTCHSIPGIEVDLFPLEHFQTAESNQIKTVESTRDECPVCNIPLVTDTWTCRQVDRMEMHWNTQFFPHKWGLLTYRSLPTFMPTTSHLFCIWGLLTSLWRLGRAHV